MPSPNVPPTYSTGYTKAEADANAVTICGYIDTNMTADSTEKAALLAWFAAAQSALIVSISSHGDGTNVGPIKAAYATLIAALT